MTSELKNLIGQVKSNTLQSRIKIAIETWDGVPQDELDEREKSTITKLIEQANTDILKQKEEEENRIKEEEENRVAEEKRQQDEAELKIKSDKIALMKFPHQDYIEEKKIVITPDIRNKIGGWNLLFKKLYKNPDNENVKNSTIKASETIKTYIMSKEEDKIKAAEKEAKEAAEKEAKEKQLAAEKEAKEAAEKEAKETSTYLGRMRRRTA